MNILGIETSCDETAAAVITATEKKAPVKLQSNVISSSLALHAQTGGIIPEIAAREQVKYCLFVIDQALNEAKIAPQDIDAIAVTYGPGLIGSLLVGVETARTLSYIWNKPLLPVNHLYGHIYANWIDIANSQWPMANGKKPKNNNFNKLYAISHTPKFPALALIVSGGHTDLVLMKDHGDLTVIGGTRDDAAGEAFDKIGRLLGLSYPAGATIAKLAEQGNPKAFSLPRPMVGSHDFDFSLSGLKTAVLNLVKKNNWDFTSQEFKKENAQLLFDLCASIEEAVTDILVRKTLKAAEKYQVQSILLGGGVTANQKLRDTMRQKASDQGLLTEISVPPKFLCTDNAAMIASAAFYRGESVSWQNVTADPKLYY